VFSTSGNADTHVILRGGKAPITTPRASIWHAASFAAAGLRQQLMIDFSHANSSKQYQRQIDVGRDVAGQVAGATHASSRNDRKPPQTRAPGSGSGQPLEYAMSITDACISWDDTIPLLRMLATR